MLRWVSQRLLRALQDNLDRTYCESGVFSRTSGPGVEGGTVYHVGRRPVYFYRRRADLGGPLKSHACIFPKSCEMWGVSVQLLLSTHVEGRGGGVSNRTGTGGIKNECAVKRSARGCLQLILG